MHNSPQRGWRYSPTSPLICLGNRFISTHSLLDTLYSRILNVRAKSAGELESPRRSSLVNYYPNKNKGGISGESEFQMS